MCLPIVLRLAQIRILYNHHESYALTCVLPPLSVGVHIFPRVLLYIGSAHAIYLEFHSNTTSQRLPVCSLALIFNDFNVHNFRPQKRAPTDEFSKVSSCNVLAISILPFISTSYVLSQSSCNMDPWQANLESLPTFWILMMVKLHLHTQSCCFDHARIIRSFAHRMLWVICPLSLVTASII